MVVSRIPLLLTFVLTLTAIASGSAFYQSPKLSVRDEVLEWTLVAGVAAFTEFYFSKTPAWTDHPLLQTRTHGEYKQETISDVWLYRVPRSSLRDEGEVVPRQRPARVAVKPA